MYLSTTSICFETRALAARLATILRVQILQCPSEIAFRSVSVCVVRSGNVYVMLSSIDQPPPLGA